MILMVFVLSTAGELVRGSGIHQGLPEAAPVVAAASSQYFERTFNRLVTAPPVIPIAPVPISPPQSIFNPVIPVAPPPPVFEPIIPAAQPPVIVEATRTTSIPAPTNPPQNDPNVAIAIATAHAAAPVATILLPPYPFGFPPSFGFIPQPESTNAPTESTPSTQSTTFQTTTEREQEATTPISSTIDNSFAQALPSNDNNFAQALPSNDNVNFKLYGPPLQPPPPSAFPTKPQKLKTSVEVVPVPLAYIAPPPLQLHHHHHGHHHHRHHQALKIPHYHTFIPKTRIIIRPVSSPLRVRTIRVPAALISHSSSHLARNAFVRQSQNLRSREPEPTTFRPFNRPILKPPRL